MMPGPYLVAHPGPSPHLFLYFVWEAVLPDQTQEKGFILSLKGKSW